MHWSGKLTFNKQFLRLTWSISFWISAARITKGPRTAYSNFNTFGFKFCSVNTLDMVLTAPRLLKGSTVISNASDLPATPGSSRMAPLIIFIGRDIFTVVHYTTLTTLHMNATINENCISISTKTRIYIDFFQFISCGKWGHHWLLISIREKMNHYIFSDGYLLLPPIC